MNSLFEFLDATKDADTISIIGFPLLVNDKILDCAAICQKGDILGIVPKKILSAEEKRHFSLPSDSLEEVRIGTKKCVFGSDLVFCHNTVSEFRFGVELGNELFAPIPPSSELALGGATVIVNPSAFPQVTGFDKALKNAVSSQSSRCKCAYILASAEQGESTTDYVYGGNSLICECGEILCEKHSFDSSESVATEIDVKLLSYERRSDSSWSDRNTTIRNVFFESEIRVTELTRGFPTLPFVPKNKDIFSEYCRSAYDIAATGLAQRMTAAHAKKLVIGISGGLDSCLALLICAKTCELLDRPTSDIIAVTMPCFGTTQRTLSNAKALCLELGCQLRSIDITNSVKLHFSDIGHNESVKNAVYENSQARERTQILMDIANGENALVVGTGDMSELALGWATYNGDHMSMYAVNAGIPKTFVRALVSYKSELSDSTLAAVLKDILDTPISPELLPANNEGDILQITEDLVGPYELHDFFIYYTLRHGYSPDKLYRVARIAFCDLYDSDTVLKWLNTFLRRFFSQQFKRSCLPDGPAVTPVTLSPREGWRMPSDAYSAPWLETLKQ